jgi:hypothetical protein
MHTMNRLLLATALLAAPALTHHAEVQASPIQRCAAGGSVIYTDKACRSLGAQPVAMSGELIRSLARAAVANGQDPEEVVPGSKGPAPEEVAAAQAYLAARRNGAGCARSPDQLQLLLRGAIALHDVNKIASVYNWAGMSTASAPGILTRLESLGHSPVMSTQYYNATFGDAALATMSMTPVAMRPAANGAGYLQLVQSGGEQVTEFEVHKLAGCYFISY